MMVKLWNGLIKQGGIELTDVIELTEESGIIKLFEAIKRVLKSEQYIIELHQLESNLPKILQALQEYPKLKELYINNTNILLKIKAENEEKQKLLDEVFARVDRYQDKIVPELEQEINQLKQLKHRTEKRLETLKQNLSYCSSDGRTREIIESNIRICESILKDEST